MSLSEIHDRSIKAVDDWLRIAFPQASRAGSWQLQKSGFSASSDGWRLRLRDDVSVLITVDRLFPYSKPVAALFGPGAPEDGPHVESERRLCIVAPSTTTDGLDPAGVVKYFIEHAASLLHAIEREEMQDDFRIDFQAYWSRESTVRGSIQTLFDIAPSTRSLFLRRYLGRRILSDDSTRLERWISHRTSKSDDAAFESSVFIWLDALPYPKGYPSSLADVRELISSAAPDLPFDDLLPEPGSERVIIIGGPTSLGQTAAGAIILSAQGGPQTSKGFRPGKVRAMPRGMGIKVQRLTTRAVDAAITRLPLPQLQAAGDIRVAILGCGSLGSGVAKLLAQQGIRDLQLFDPDVLGWENIGRHELGASDVGSNKARALENKLLRHLPDLKSVTSFDGNWQSALLDDPSLFGNVDLIVSATGDWGSDAALSDLQARGVIAIPVVYGWLERNAIAAHAVAIRGTDGCFRCGFDNTGRPRTMASSWWSDDPDPRCGGGASPYGAIDLAAAQSLLARSALDVGSARAATPLWRVWTGLTSDLEAAGGFWSGRFRSVVGDPGEGGKLMGAQWQRDDRCECH